MAKLSDIELQSREISIKQGDGRDITLKLSIDTKPMDLTGYTVRYAIKELKNIDVLDQNSILHGGNGDVVDDPTNGTIRIQLDPEITKSFPVSKSNNPLILAIGIGNKQTKFSHTLNYKLTVGINVLTSIY